MSKKIKKRYKLFCNLSFGVGFLVSILSLFSLMIYIIALKKEVETKFELERLVFSILSLVGYLILYIFQIKT